MPKFFDKRLLSYSPKQLYDIVLDVENYPKFLPWCNAAKIIEKNNEFIVADLIIRYKAFAEKYRSHIIPSQVDDDYFIKVSLINGPFSHLNNQWNFLNFNNQTTLEVTLDFAFKSVILEKLTSLVFEQASKKIILAFQNRAEEVYGT